jgi:EpsI family protein
MGFLKNRYAQILTLALVAQAVLFYGLSHGENVPLVRPLDAFPAALGDWTMVQAGVMDKGDMEALRADDAVVRTYMQGSNHQIASLFVAYFKSQRTGQTPHSPKNCMPGNGWSPTESGTVSFSVPGEPRPIEVNRYIVNRGDQASAVLYWYQTNRRVIASEYRAKIYSVVDAMRYNRTDTALVRVVVPIQTDSASATNAAILFIQALFEPLRHYLPS